MTLKQNEIRLWQEVVTAYCHTTAGDFSTRHHWGAILADRVVLEFRKRLEDPGPAPDASRL